MAKVLLIDDDLELVEMLKEYLEQNGYQVLVAHDGEEGLQLTLAGGCEIAVLDVMMPKMKGAETVHRLRTIGTLPGLMLTAKGDDTERILGLELGGIFQPFFRGSHTPGDTYGHGLGLAIARRTIDAHRGTIRASNLGSGGSRVDISLPSGARH